MGEIYSNGSYPIRFLYFFSFTFGGLRKRKFLFLFSLISLAYWFFFFRFAGQSFCHNLINIFFLLSVTVLMALLVAKKKIKLIFVS